MRLAVLALFAAPAAAGGNYSAEPLPEGESRHSIQHGLYERSFIVYVPPGRRIEGLVMQFHGLGSNDAEQCMYSHARQGSDDNGYVTVCPNGWSVSWNAGPGLGPPDGCCPPANLAGIDDMGFVRSMLRFIDERGTTRGRIPEGKVFTAGMSNGGMISYRIACELSDIVHGAAPVTGAFFSSYPCAPSHPRPVIHFHGTNDALVDYTNTIRDWRRYSTDVLGCAAGSEREVYRSGAVHCLQYDACARASAPGTSAFCTYDGMGHVWPGGTGTPDYGLPATPTMWDFWTGRWPAKAATHPAALPAGNVSEPLGDLPQLVAGREATRWPKH